MNQTDILIKPKTCKYNKGCFKSFEQGAMHKDKYLI